MLGRPVNHISLVEAQAACQAVGRRLCTSEEWTFACEGEELRPYPYGFARGEGRCNIDRLSLLDQGGKLRDLRAPTGAHVGCVSPFGVLDLMGNVEEVVSLPEKVGLAGRAGLKGAWWLPGRGHCRAIQTAHDIYYSGTETGFRCCLDVG